MRTLAEEASLIFQEVNFLSPYLILGLSVKLLLLLISVFVYCQDVSLMCSLLCTGFGISCMSPNTGSAAIFAWNLMKSTILEKGSSVTKFPGYHMLVHQNVPLTKPLPCYILYLELYVGSFWRALLVAPQVNCSMKYRQSLTSFDFYFNIVLRRSHTDVIIQKVSIKLKFPSLPAMILLLNPLCSFGFIEFHFAFQLWITNFHYQQVAFCWNFKVSVWSHPQLWWSLLKQL